MTFVPESLNSAELMALRYIRETQPTEAEVTTKHHVISPKLWTSLLERGWAVVDEAGKVVLTDAGNSIVDSQAA